MASTRGDRRETTAPAWVVSWQASATPRSRQQWWRWSTPPESRTRGLGANASIPTTKPLGPTCGKPSRRLTCRSPGRVRRERPTRRSTWQRRRMATRSGRTASRASKATRPASRSRQTNRAAHRPETSAHGVRARAAKSDGRCAWASKVRRAHRHQARRRCRHRRRRRRRRHRGRPLGSRCCRMHPLETTASTRGTRLSLHPKSALTGRRAIQNGSFRAGRRCTPCCQDRSIFTLEVAL